MKKRILIAGIICSMVALPLQGCGDSSTEVSSNIESTTELTTESTTELTTESTTESTTELITELTTEVITESTTESTTELTTEAIEEIMTENTTQATIVQSNGNAIYITRTGKKYHYNNNCNGATYIEITIEQLNAEYSTLEPCSKCAM